MPGRMLPAPGIPGRWVPGPIAPTAFSSKSPPVIGSLYLLRRNFCLNQDLKVGRPRCARLAPEQLEGAIVLLAAPDQLRLLFALCSLAPHRQRHRHHDRHQRHGDEQRDHGVSGVVARHLRLVHWSTILVREMVSRNLAGLCALVLLASAAGCDKVPLTAPTESTIVLSANGSSVPLAGGVDVTATVTEKPGTPVQNGTLVTFTTTLGRVEPSEAQTTNGRVTVRLVGDGRWARQRSPPSRAQQRRESWRFRLAAPLPRTWCCEQSRALSASSAAPSR